MNINVMCKLLAYVPLLAFSVAAGQARAESIEQFNHSYYTQVCEGIIACSDDVRIAESMQYMRITNVQACVSMFTERDQPKQWNTALTQKTVRFNPASSEACLSAVSEASCATLSGRLARPAVIKGCEAVIVGAVENLAKCDSSLECKSNAASCVGTCEEPRPLLCGEDLCNSSEYCDFENKTCAAPKKLGAACANSTECQNSCISGTCQLPRPVVKPGGLCGKGTSRICSIGEYCINDQCTPFREEGQSCSAEYDESALCKAPFDCLEGKCSNPS